MEASNTRPSSWDPRPEPKHIQLQMPYESQATVSLQMSAAETLLSLAVVKFNSRYPA